MKHALKLLLATSVFGIVGFAHAGPPDQGKQVFDRWCSACHAPAPRMPGTVALAGKYNGQLPAALEERKDLTAAMVKLFVRRGISIMPPFRKTEITDAELDALADYLSPPKPAVH